MAKSWPLAFGLFFLAWSLSVGGLPSRAGDQLTCFENWSDAAPLVKDYGLVSVRDLSKMAKETDEGTVVKTTLCRDEEGELVYKLVLRGEDGKLIRKTVNARQPFER